MSKEVTFAVVGTNKLTEVRKTLKGGFKSKESAEKELMKYKNDKYIKSCFRYIKVAKEDYGPRMEGSCGTLIKK